MNDDTNEQEANSSVPATPDEEFPWSVEELSLPETWWLILQPAVNLTQVGGTTWNRVPTRPKPSA